MSKTQFKNCPKAQGNNTDTNYIDFSDTDPFFPSGFCGKEVDETDEFTRYYQYFYEQLSMDYLKQDYPYDHEILDLILHLIIEVMCSNRTVNTNCQCMISPLKLSAVGL